MSKIKLTAGEGTEAEVDLKGATLTKLRIAQNDLIKYPLKGDDPAKGYPSALLFPFPNRVRDGRYTFDGTEYSLPINEVDNHNAIHGLIAFEHFQVIEQEESKVVLEYRYLGEIEGYPFPYAFKIEYALKSDALAIQVEATNTGETDMPCGFGWHPYFGFDGQAIGEMTVKAPRRNKLELSERLIPTGEFETERSGLIPLKNTILDNIFVLDGKTTGVSEIELRYKKKKLIVSQKTGKNKLNHFILYTPATRDCIAIEPQSCSTNAFNNADGLIVLKPEKKIKFEINVKLEL
ncbi:aldose 1-epimerase [Marinilongibacter aquaticus]|uniref:aldose 1-epimerase n=1 Tax=Marinilongibacter aquaticus TaxID=2975157 RepID=UPI0021BCFC0B|nr:aldose 1-epimerase [Marinilongibacter aquaticus]UBM59319.1 aldose 1-epimerase [Marinilongibacter aquaticus]